MFIDVRVLTFSDISIVQKEPMWNGDEKLLPSEKPSSSGQGVLLS
jgi:hypothetical protein